MRNTRFLTALTLCSLFPISLTPQSVSPVPIPEPMPIPHLVINISVPHIEPSIHPVLPMSFPESDRDLPVQEQETIQKTFSMSGTQHRSLEIDNVWGSIEVVGTNSDQVQLTVNKSTRAETKDKLEQARKEVTLDITEQNGLLKLYVNGPFRCHCDDGCGRREFEGYIVKMDFQLRVPRDIDIKVKTVNEGHVVVRDINGNFLVRNVNGDVEMTNIAGSGTARTVNGPVKASFLQNPREASDFQTINGNVELRFAPGLAADFRFKTFNGGIYSDFPVTALPVRAVQEERYGGKFVFHADRYTGVRVSSGGPEIKVENLNGDIRILENHE
ncbi:MAG TPA: hypothetical protein VJN92_23910 [Candidatus Acidoferrum sp.]|nr:hypothetical protein [Candidatus Acidoferrum sp.]